MYYYIIVRLQAENYSLEGKKIKVLYCIYNNYQKYSDMGNTLIYLQ